MFDPAYETDRTVSGWLEKNKDRVSGYYDHEQFLKIFFDKTLSLNEHNVKGQIYASNEIDNIASYPNKVIVTNEYKFMDENSKEHISLLEEGYVVDSREEKGLLPFILNATKNIVSIDTGKKHQYSKR